MTDQVNDTEAIVHSVFENAGIAADELAHYGVKGMKWGVSRAGLAKGRIASEDHIESRKSKRKKQSEMSTAELRKLNERLQLERTNNDLQSRSGMAKIKAGTQMVGTILAVGGTINSAYNFAKSPAGKVVIENIKKLT